MTRDFIKRWVLPGIWLIIVTFGTYYLFFRREDIDQAWWGLLGYVRIAFVVGGIVLTYAYLLWKQRRQNVESEPRLKRLIHYCFRLCKWENHDEHVRWCTGCGILQLNANYPLKTEPTEWMMFPLGDEEMEEYFDTPEEERYLSDALFAYLRRMEELGLK